MRKKTALFIGRFQPLHRGHLHALRHAFRKYDSVIIAVGSINKRDGKNPFSFAERKKMLNEALKEYEGRYRIVGVKDTTDEKWIRKIRKIKYDVIISGNDYVWHLLKGEHLEKPAFLRPAVYNGTKIREKMIRGISIVKLVPSRIIKITERKN